MGAYKTPTWVCPEHSAEARAQEAKRMHDQKQHHARLLRAGLLGITLGGKQP